MSQHTMMTKLTRANLVAKLVPEIMEVNKSREKLLYKIKKRRLKLINSLAREGCQRATEMARFKDQPDLQDRCGRHCVGCIAAESREPCGSCPGCVHLHICMERGRRCLTWDHHPNPHMVGPVSSVMSLVYQSAALSIDQLTPDI